VGITIAAVPGPPVGTPPSVSPPASPSPSGDPGPFSPPPSPPAGDGTLTTWTAAGELSDSFVAGAGAVIEATGYSPGSTLTFVAYSTPTVLGTAVADSTGSARVTVALPAALAVGTHTLVSFGAGTTGDTRSLTRSIEVTAAPGAPRPSLAYTGADTGGLLLTGLLLLAVGGLAVLAPVRRRGRPQEDGEDVARISLSPVTR
jgi:hypothetical protein